MDSEGTYEGYDNFDVVSQSKKEKNEREEKGKTRFADMAPLLRYDFALAEYMVGTTQRFENVVGDGRRDALLLGEGKTPGFNQLGMRELGRL